MQSISARRISDEPLINWVHRHLVSVMLFLYVAALFYLCFVPFDFTLHPRTRPHMHLLSGMTMSIFALSDLLVNIAMYVPLGLLAMLAARRLGFGKAAAAFCCVGAGTLLSFGIEKGQGWTVSRVSAWSDVAANSLGMFLGVVTYWFAEPFVQRAIGRVQSLARRNVWFVLGQGLIAAILLVQLRPYDVVVDPARTMKNLRAADPRPMARWNSLENTVRREIGIGRRTSMTELARVQCDYILDRASDVICYAVLGAVLVWSMVAAGRSRTSAIISAGLAIAALGGAITIIRVFLISHGLDTLHFCCALLGWAMGTLVALTCDIRNQKATSVGVAAVFSIVGVACVLYGLVPFQFGPRHGSISFGPFFGHFGSRINDALMDISGDFVRYGLIAVLIAVGSMHGRASWRMRSVLIVATVGALAATIECLHLYIPFRHADMTGAYVALAGGCCAVVAVRWACDYRASSVVVAEDALTSALIDGATYDKSRPAGVKPGSRRSDASRKDREESNQRV